MKSFAPKPKNRYRVVDGKTSIELKLKSPHQLFDERDPAPFRERDLDDDAARYIVDSYRAIHTGPKDVKLSLYFADMGVFEGNGDIIKKAIRSYFEYEAELKGHELRDTFRQGFISLAIGVTFLIFTTWVSHSTGDGGDPGFFKTLFKEWSLLMGWVSMWKPISIFLYEWWPIRGTMQTLAELSEIEIDVKSADRAPILDAAELRRDSAVAISFAGTLKSS